MATINMYKMQILSYITTQEMGPARSPRTKKHMAISANPIYQSDDTIILAVSTL